MAMTFLIAHCGDSSTHIRTGGGVNPSAGTFQGTLDRDGSTITIVVDSIRSIAFQCDTDAISQTFEPPKQVDSDGTFSIEFTDAGRKFRVTGTFTDNNTLDGFIDDENNHCDTGFSATRTGAVQTPTGVVRTPTPGGPTSTSGGPTSTAVGPTSTAVGPTSTSATGTPTGPTPTGPTPTGETPTPGPTSTAGGGGSCPTKVTIEGQGDQADLDSGWTGIAQNTKVINKGALTVALDCHGNNTGSCGSCDVSGPIASTTVVNNHRCAGNTSMTCSADGDCASSGPCNFIFGAPLPLSSGGVPVCVTNRVSASITGTANPDTGSGASTVALISAVFTGLTVDQPCPRCSGSGFNQTGTCAGGARDGMSCTVHGTSAQFGNTSLDCPPNAGANIGNLNIALNPTTGTSQLQPSHTCTSIPFNGKACYCQGQQQANACMDGICTDPNGTGGTCEAGPFDQFCSIQTFRGCFADSDCPTGAGNCQGAPVVRPCTGQTDASFAITNAMTRTGHADPNTPTLASTFCIAATSSSAVNTAGGLPGPGGLTLPGKACYTDTCSF
jgi:hypothetical protein